MSGELDNIPIVFVKQSNGPITDATLNAIKETSLYEIKDIITDPDKGKEMVQNGHAKAVLILPSNYENTDHIVKNIILYADSSDQIARSALVTGTQTLFNEISNEIGVKELNIMNLQTPSIQSNSAQISNSTVQTPRASS